MFTYSRDSRSPVPSSPIASRVMRKNRSKDTGPELRLRKELRESGLSGYRIHWRNAPGRPDIAYPSKRVAIFVHGCFWHRCPRCELPLPRTNTGFWEQKFKANKERDERKLRELEEAGWDVIVVWECEIEEDIEIVVERISEVLSA